MKTLFTLVACTLAVTASAQSDYDSLKQKILKMDVAINNIHNNMVKAHDQFRTGTILVVAGIVTTVVGVAVLTKKVEDPNTYDHGKPVASTAPIYVGSGLVTVGGIMQIDSHKWIGRAGRKENRRATQPSGRKQKQ